MNFMNLPEEYAGDETKFFILPIEYEGNVTAGKGAVNGSKEIVRASYQLEYYDEQFKNEAFAQGIKLLPSLELAEVSPEEMVSKVAQEVIKLNNKFLITVGGDHSVTIGTLQGLEQSNEEFSVIVFDAHADMFYSWNDSRFNHRCVNSYASGKHDVAIVGLRSLDKDEADIIEKSDNIHAVYAFENLRDKLKEILPKLKNKVYISIDVDVFDPAFIRNTGTPEPGGLDWYTMIDLLKLIFEQKEVIGAGVVEFAPNENYTAEAYSLAKLVYKLISMKEKFCCY
ncbi:MAG: agmatinase [archaeon]|nr:agmatinase [Nanoarchaeota archaeon]